MRAKVNSCVFGVMGESQDGFQSENSSSSQLTMCPLTSLISTSSQSEMGSVYPRRILLSFLRLRLFGKQEPVGKTNQQQTAESSHHSSGMILSHNCNNSQVIITTCTGDDDKVMGSNRKIQGKQRHPTATTMQPRKTESETGGTRNNPVFSSNEQHSSHKSCASCSLNSSQFSQNDNQYSLANPHFVEMSSGTTTETKSGPSSPSSSPSPSRNVFSDELFSKERKSWLSFLANGACRKSKLAGVKIVLLLFIICLLMDSSLACGPGRGAGRRRAPRKLTPLVYKQHVPNVPESTLSASGFTEGRITRRDQKFKNLVPNYNPDIIFRDEEGTGADRLMTQRCKEKLNTLAISVMNQWPGVKLRVIEGWDEDLHHATHSLHYEGRAVDITTSDKDRSKYGMLARLAVEAGFDWVYYESRAHIHCSVKSDSSQASRTGGCFSGNATVETPSGPRRMEEIKLGDKILSIDSNGKEVFSDVLMFLDRNTTEVREFFEVTTESGATLTLTPSHLLYSIQPEGITPDDGFLLAKNRYLKSEEISKYFLSQAEITFAKFVEVGDWLLVKQSNQGEGSESNMINYGTADEAVYVAERVIRIDAKVETGVFAPLTSTGNLVVDGVLTSCYALIEDQSLAHLAFAPVRLAHNFRQSVSYLWKEFSRLITFSHVLFPSSSKESSNSNSAINSNSIADDSQHQQKPDRSSPVKAHETAKGLSEARSNVSPTSEQGIHWYASLLYSATKYILPPSLLYD